MDREGAIVGDLLSALVAGDVNRIAGAPVRRPRHCERLVRIRVHVLKQQRAVSRRRDMRRRNSRLGARDPERQHHTRHHRHDRSTPPSKDPKLHHLSVPSTRLARVASRILPPRAPTPIEATTAPNEVKDHCPLHTPRQRQQTRAPRPNPTPGPQAPLP